MIDQHNFKLVQKAFNKTAHWYDDYSTAQQQAGIHLIELVVNHRHNYQQVLDVGCGTGLTTQTLLNSISFDYACLLDHSLNHLAIAQHRFTGTKTTFLLQDFDQYTLTADLIFSNFSLHWSQHFFVTLQSITTHMRKGDLLAFTIPLSGTFAHLPSYSKNNFYTTNEVSSFLNARGKTHFQSQNIEIIYPCMRSALQAIKKSGANTLLGPINYSQHRQRAQHLRTHLKKSPQPFKLNYYVGYFVFEK